MIMSDEDMDLILYSIAQKYNSKENDEIKLELLHCPICKRKVQIKNGNENWYQSFYDPDSGGEPYSIECECGLKFSIGYCDITELIKRWNNRVPMNNILSRFKKLKNFITPKGMAPIKMIECSNGISGWYQAVDHAATIINEENI